VRAEHAAYTEDGTERHRFVDAMGAYFDRYGAAATVGRVFALLLTSNDPLSLDDIADWLGTSKSGTSVAARDLERLGLVRRQLTRGSRRILYEASDDMAAIFDAQFARIREQRGLFAQAEPLVKSAPAAQRLQRMLELHDFWLTESARIIDHWRRR
jgi:DNA-binding transcriptional regulator GbsR (MarR family)